MNATVTPKEYEDIKGNKAKYVILEVNGKKIVLKGERVYDEVTEAGITDKTKNAANAMEGKK